MVAFTQKRRKKSTVSARNLRTGEGMVYSLPGRKGQKLPSKADIHLSNIMIVT